MDDLPFFPEQASSYAFQVDLLYWVLIALSALFAIPIAGLIVFLSIKYRAGKNVDRTNPPETDHRLEAAWIVIPLGLAMAVFVWSTFLYLELTTAPANAMQVYVVGKQWMWKFQHPTGQREINELHIPVGQPIKMILTSQDVIHDVYIPAFRVKMDAIPGRYTDMWFLPTKTGEYYLHCAEYCGAQHALMGGRVIVMEPADYQAWLSNPRAGSEGVGQTDEPASLAAAGEQLFTSLGCSGCHNPAGGGAGPSLVGIFGETERLEDGSTVVVDEDYIQQSILQPQAAIVAGYPPIMPSYEGQVTDEQLAQLVEYIRSLGVSGDGGSQGGGEQGGGEQGGGEQGTQP